MSNVLVINVTNFETRVALIQDGLIHDFFMERDKERNVVSNIYKGKSLRVLPGMQASFVDVAQEQAGFLHASDFYDFDKDLAAFRDDNKDLWPPPSQGDNSNYVKIENVLNEGEEIMVQIAKEPIGTKGARLTSQISIPGRYLVFMPTVSHIGISRQIEDRSERKRLRNLISKHRPPGTGFIVRTVSEDVSDEILKREIDLLVKHWEDILEKANRADAPYLLYEEPDLLIRCTRDLFTPDLDKLIVDDEGAYQQVTDYTEKFMPEYTDSVELYQGEEPVFDAFGIESEINRALSREVELESGGEIVFDHTEALTSIDVNTGGFVGDESQAETILQTNIEAAEEIIYQLRLRSIGGIIICDFIDMEDPEHRKQVNQVLHQAIDKDKVPTNALPISEFGLVEMTRKRVRESLIEFLWEPCSRCNSHGFVKSKDTVAYEIIREIKRQLPIYEDPNITIEAHPDVIQLLRGSERQTMETIAEESDKEFHYISLSDYPVDVYDIYESEEQPAEETVSEAS
jgi:ribonuclease G